MANLKNAYMNTKIGTDLTTQAALGLMTGGVSLFFTLPHSVLGGIIAAGRTDSWDDAHIEISARGIARKAKREYSDRSMQYTLQNAMLHGVMAGAGRTPALGLLALAAVGDALGYMLKPLTALPLLFAADGEARLRKAFNFEHHMSLTKTTFDLSRRLGIFSGARFEENEVEGSLLNRLKRPKAPKN